MARSTTTVRPGLCACIFLVAMQINISGKALAAAAGTALLGVASWLLLGHIDHGNRLVSLETSDANDARQDAELAEVRATMRDLIRLTAELAGHDHDGSPVETSAPMEEPLADVGYADDHDHDGALPEEYGDFRTEQADLESILRGRGIEPAAKNQLDQ